MLAADEKAGSMAYLYLLKRVESHMGKTGETTNSELDKCGREMLGSKYIGTYAHDIFPFSELTSGMMGICNTDTADGPGEHWVAVAMGKEQKNTLFIYDSFGRRSLLDVPVGIEVDEADSDAEQEEAEENCGQRCLAWLLVFEHLGEKIADTI